jgi:hypothetical protein
MSSVEEIRDAILQLTPGERTRLMAEIGPDLCRSVMGNPALMMEMMPKCQEMMKDPEIMKAMRPMMERMMQGMMPGGAPDRSA